MDEARAIAMIPGRMGSTRLAMKNLALLAGHPVMSYAIRAAREAGVFDRVVVNADHEAFAEVAARYGAEFYLRPPALGSSEARSDDVVLDFMDAHPAQVVAWVNPTSPLQAGAEVREVVEAFFARGLDSLISVETRQVHCMLGDRPVNFRTDEKFARTQDLVPTHPFVYSVMMWRTEPFRAQMRRAGHAVFCGRFGTHPVSRLSGIVIKTEEDLRLADAVLRARTTPFHLAYDPAAPGSDHTPPPGKKRKQGGRSSAPAFGRRSDRPNYR